MQHKSTTDKEYSYYIIILLAIKYSYSCTYKQKFYFIQYIL